jgi:hypothetical protein
MLHLWQSHWIFQVDCNESAAPPTRGGNRIRENGQNFTQCLKIGILILGEGRRLGDSKADAAFSGSSLP